MQKIILPLTFLLALVFAVTEPLLVSAQELGMTTLQECWKVERENISNVEVASDNVRKIFISLNDGSIEALNSETGETLWKSSLGGKIISKPLFENQSLYLASSESTETPDRPTDNNQTKGNQNLKNTAEINVRLISPDSGLTKWQTKIETEVLTEAEFNILPLLSNADKLFLVTSTGKIFTILKDDGKIIKQDNLEPARYTQAVLLRDKIYVGSNERTLISYSINEQRVLSSLNLEEIPTTIVPEAESKLIIGDKSGRTTAVNPLNRDIIWRSRSGAEINNIAKNRRGFAVSSTDNFIYLISDKNGGRIWKKRLAGRNTVLPSLTGDLLFSVNLNGDVATVIDTEKGKTVNQIVLPGGRFFVNKPLILRDELLILQNNAGLTAYSSKVCSVGSKKQR